MTDGVTVSTSPVSRSAIRLATSMVMAPLSSVAVAVVSCASGVSFAPATLTVRVLVVTTPALSVTDTSNTSDTGPTGRAFTAAAFTTYV